MNIKNDNQQGSIHLVVIIVLVLCLVGALGWIFWQNFMQTKPQSAATTTQTVSKTTTPSPSAAPADTTKYFTVTDWGVRFKLSDSLKDTTVRSKKYNDEAQSPYGFSTDRVISIYGAGSGCDSIVVLDRMTDKLMTGGPGTSLLLNTTKLNGYYYYAEYSTTKQYTANPNAPGKAPACLDAPDELTLVESMKSIEIIPS